MGRDIKFINLDTSNINNEHICCIIRSKTVHPGVEAKKEWLKERIKEGHVFRKLDVKDVVYIEYAPLEKAWVPIEGKNYLYIYCLWVSNNYQHQGYGKELLEYCIEDAKRKGKSGVCLLGSKKKKHWLTDPEFVKKYGFKVVDRISDEYELLALSFDESIPSFCENAKKMKSDNKELTLYYDDQCPYIINSVNNISNYCQLNNVPYHIIKVDSLDKAKNLPCVFNNYALFYQGKLVTVNILLDKSFDKIIKK